MSTWKVILATLVIFIAGLFTGAALLLKFGPGSFPPGRPFEQGQMREAYVQRLTRDLKLTPLQTDKVRTIMSDSQQRMHDIFEKVREDIREVLTPEQQRLFDQMPQRRPGRRGPGPLERRGRFRGPPSFFESNRLPPPPEPPPPEPPAPQ